MTPESQVCHRHTPHPRHSWVLARTVYRCPGIALTDHTETVVGLGKAIEILTEFEQSLPTPHQERPGVIRAIEVLRHA